MRILVTGAAGFIGFALTQRLLQQGHDVIGFDNLNDYYDVDLKNARLNLLKKQQSFQFVRGDLATTNDLKDLFKNHGPFDIIYHLAAQAGVRYSLKAPLTYIESNVKGLVNLLEEVKNAPPKNFIFASSSSVYGNPQNFPTPTHAPTDKPISLYAASKKSGEAICHSYAHLYPIPTTILRFFTVYGPYGRPDMSPFIFTDKILKGEEIPLYGDGSAERSFTYIDDIVDGIIAAGERVPQGLEIFNLGNPQTEKLIDLIHIIEDSLGKTANLKFLPQQAGDVDKTAADITKEKELLGFNPQVTLRTGIKNFTDWFKFFYEHP